MTMREDCAERRDLTSAAATVTVGRGRAVFPWWSRCNEWLQNSFSAAGGVVDLQIVISRRRDVSVERCGTEEVYLDFYKPIPPAFFRELALHWFVIGWARKRFGLLSRNRNEKHSLQFGIVFGLLPGSSHFASEWSGRPCFGEDSGGEASVGGRETKEISESVAGCSRAYISFPAPIYKRVRIKLSSQPGLWGSWSAAEHGSLLRELVLV